MDDDLQNIKTRSLASVVSLLAQSSYAAVLGFIAFFILTLKSGVYILGIYNTVLATMSSFNYFTNLGLAAAIMQKKKVEQIDLNTAFYIQITLTICAVIIGYLLTPYVFSFYKDLPNTAVPLYWSLLISFFFLSFKSIPSVLLEKDIQIYKVVFVQAVENTIFYVVVIVLVVLGYELQSLMYAILARAVAGLILIYALRPWRPTFSFSIQSAKALLSYGIPFQSNSFLAIIKDDLLIIYLGGAIGLTNLGYVTFAKKYAEFSIRLVMDNMNRVAFPLFAKFQHDAELLKKSLRKVFFYESLFILPMSIGGIFIFDSILKVIPGGYYEKWNPALFSFYFFTLSAIFVSLYSPLINFFNAVGKVKTSLLFMVYFTVLTWALIPPLINIIGFNGISLAFFIMSLSFIFVLRKAKKITEFSLFKFIKDNILAVSGMAIYLTFIRMIGLPSIHNFFYVLLSIVGGACVYLGILYKIRGKRLYEDITGLHLKSWH